jgi:hypothetical protein
MVRIPTNSVALAGEFAALSQLAIRGYVASMTLGNTKSIDILVFDPVTKKTYQVEVKTNHQRRNGPTDSKLHGKFVTSWQMHEKHERIRDPDLFYCFVHINARPTDAPKDAFRFFIVPSAVVAKYVKAEHQAWLRNNSAHRTSPRRLFRIGLPNDRKIEVPAPLASDYEDNWNLVASPSVAVVPETDGAS